MGLPFTTARMHTAEPLRRCTWAGTSRGGNPRAEKVPSW
jgi:hypothetical protein